MLGSGSWSGSGGGGGNGSTNIGPSPCSLLPPGSTRVPGWQRTHSTGSYYYVRWQCQ